MVTWTARKRERARAGGTPAAWEDQRIRHVGSSGGGVGGYSGGTCGGGRERESGGFWGGAYLRPASSWYEKTAVAVARCQMCSQPAELPAATTDGDTATEVTCGGIPSTPWSAQYAPGDTASSAARKGATASERANRASASSWRRLASGLAAAAAAAGTVSAAELAESSLASPGHSGCR